MKKILVVILFILAINNLSNGQKNEEVKQLEEVIHRSCVACYSTEGVYPEDIDYLKENYNIQISDKYIVHYERIASNVMPTVKVLVRDENK